MNRLVNAISVTEANSVGISALLRQAEDGDVLVQRNGRPVAAVVSTDRLRQIERAREDVLDAALALSRLTARASPTTSLSDALALFGLDRDAL